MPAGPVWRGRGRVGEGCDMFRYELHCHTVETSVCGKWRAEDMVRRYHERGYTGLCVTDHLHPKFLAKIDHEGDWQRCVDAFLLGYRAAKAAGEALGMDILFGIEEGVGDGKEVLLYGITPQFLYDHPEIRDCDLPHLSRIVREAGGFFVQAHPFRVRDYIPRPWEALDPDLFDGVEIYNACNPPLDNLRAVQWAANNGLPPIAGSDRHYMGHCENFGILVDRRIRTEEELAQVLMEGDYSLNTPGV